MSRLRFGAFLAPHHPLGEHPSLLLQRDLELAAFLDKLGYDEFWVGEHHSTGWEMIASPELFLAAAGERTQRIRLGTGVVSLPYHHPFNVCQRMVQLDHMTGGRVIFGTGPGALPSDARTHGIAPNLLRDRQDEAIGVCMRLLAGERFTYHSDWFELNDAALQILPLQETMPMAVASSISPSGMTLAGKYGIGVLSIASTSTEGLMALPTQWSFAEQAAEQHGQTVDRARLACAHVVASRRDARPGDPGVRARPAALAQRVQREGARPARRRADARRVRGGRGDRERRPDLGAGAGIIGTPDDAIERIRALRDIVGGFGVVLGFAHDWANREATLRSWELFARYVVPEINGYLRPMRDSADYVTSNKDELMAGAVGAIMEAIGKHKGATEAAAETARLIANAGPPSPVR